MTADDRSFAPPHELVGPLGQVVDAGGGFVPGLAPAPVPGALGTASPGLAAAAVSPAPLPHLGPDDPGAFAIAIARLAGEMFGVQPPGTLAPVPIAPASALTPSNVQLPASPGIAPALVPSPLSGAPAGMPDHSARAAPVATAPPATPPADTHGSPFAAPLVFDGPAFDGTRFGAIGAPGFGSAVTPASNPATSAPSAGLATGTRPKSGPVAGGAIAGLPIAGAPTAGTPSAELPTAGAPIAQSPFAMPLGPLPVFDAPRYSLLEGAALPDGARLPELPLYFVPSADAIGLDGDRRAPRIETHELDARPVIRDLGGSGFDPYAVRRDFPILEERVHGGKRLVWLDNAATTQKPSAVIDRLLHFYEHENSNIHRAAHALAARATDAYEGGRESVRRFINAPSASEIVFVRGATEGINLVAQSWGRRNVGAGDEIVITHLEHHANIVPWQQLCAAMGARLRVAPVDDRGDVILEAYERLLGPRTRLVAFPQVSNALGTVTPAREMIEIAHRHGAVVLLDGAQAVSHMRADVQLLDCDFYVFSGHKVFAPTGIGAVFGKRALLDAMPPWQGGGNMIQDVTFERTTYQQPPWRFEAGTGNIADAVGLGTALDYVTHVGIDAIDRYEHDLLGYADRQLATVPGLHMIGAPREKAGVLSFVLDGQRTEDVGSALDQEGIAVRSGHHCAQPILRRFGVEASVRASLALYNTCEDIDALVAALHRLQAGRGNPR
jgi:cysteine desulfurase / selenocysteine lyase